LYIISLITLFLFRSVPKQKMNFKCVISDKKVREEKETKMWKYVEKAHDYAGKSMARDFKHGAVCIVGGKVVSGGFNYPAEPHQIKVSEQPVC